MAGTGRVVAAFTALLGATAAAQGGGCGWYVLPAVSYYAVPYWSCCYPPVLNVPDAPASKQANRPDKAPVIIARLGAGASSDVLKVGFWNFSGRDVTLTVDGKARTLPKDRALTLQLPRAFSWQIDGLPAHTERVPEGAASHEVVVRE